MNKISWRKDEIEILKNSYGKILTKDLVKKLNRSKYSIQRKARDLKLNFRTYKEINFGEETKQVLLGSLFGDGSLRLNRKNSYYIETHSINQKDYLKWKEVYLKEFNVTLIKQPPRFDKRTSKIYFPFTLRTKSHPLLTEFRNKFYNNHKKVINKELFYNLSSLGLAVLHIDDGSYSKKDKTITLHTESFSFEEQKIIQEYFKNKWNIDVKIHKHETHFVVAFSSKETKKFINLIESHILKMPSEVHYKIGK